MNRRIAMILAIAVGTAIPSFAETVIYTKDGRTIRVPVEANEIARIEFGAAQAPTPSAPPATSEPAFLQTLVSGGERSGEAWADSGGRWKCTLKITSYDRATGAVVGQITWPSLNSVHRVRGKLTGDKLTFTEVEAIRPGGAHLNVDYVFTLGKNSATGTWVDNGDSSRGGAKIE